MTVAAVVSVVSVVSVVRTMRAFGAAALLLMAVVALSAEQSVSAPPPSQAPPSTAATPKDRARSSRRRSLPRRSRSSGPWISPNAWRPRGPHAVQSPRSQFPRSSRQSKRTRTRTCASARWSCSPDSTIRERGTSCAGRSAFRTIGCARSPTRYFEHNADPTVIPKLLAAVPVESSEFVRPALTRALAAYGTDPKVRETMAGLVMKGQAFFRSAVIEALGDYRAAYAVGPITEVAKIDGPMQTDAAIALGKIGEKSSLATLAELQRTAPRESQPAIAAAICLLGVNCESHEPYLANTLRFAIATIGYQELVRGSAAGLASLAVTGREARGRGVDPPGRSDTRSGPRRHCAGGRDDRAAEYAADTESPPGRRDAGAGIRPAARGVRHARGGLRGRAVFRGSAEGLLAGTRRFAAADGLRDPDPEAGILIHPAPGS